MSATATTGRTHAVVATERVRRRTVNTPRDVLRDLFEAAIGRSSQVLHPMPVLRRSASTDDVDPFGARATAIRTSVFLRLHGTRTRAGDISASSSTAASASAPASAVAKQPEVSESDGEEDERVPRETVEDILRHAGRAIRKASIRAGQSGSTVAAIKRARARRAAHATASGATSAKSTAVAAVAAPSPTAVATPSRTRSAPSSTAATASIPTRTTTTHELVVRVQISSS